LFWTFPLQFALIIQTQIKGCMNNNLHVVTVLLVAAVVFVSPNLYSSGKSKGDVSRSVSQEENGPQKSQKEIPNTIGPEDGLLSFDVKGVWKTKTKIRGKVLKFTAANSEKELILVYFEDRSLPYSREKALDKFLKKYKFKYLLGESLIAKAVQGKERKVNVLFALGSGVYNKKKQTIFARSSLIDNTNVVFITLTPPNKFKENFPEMKRLLRYRWKDR